MTHPLIDAVREAAKREPERMGQGVYAFADEPVCIIGAGLHACGVPIGDLEMLTRPPGTCPPVSGSTVRPLLARLPELSADEMRWLVTVQANQDDSVPWGVAVRLADEEQV